MRRLRTRAERKATDSCRKAVERSWDERATVSAVAATAEGEERAAGAQGLATSARAKERKRAPTHLAEGGGWARVRARCDGARFVRVVARTGLHESPTFSLSYPISEGEKHFYSLLVV